MGGGGRSSGEAGTVGTDRRGAVGGQMAGGTGTKGTDIRCAGIGEGASGRWINDKEQRSGHLTPLPSVPTPPTCRHAAAYTAAPARKNELKTTLKNYTLTWIFHIKIVL